MTCLVDFLNSIWFFYSITYKSKYSCTIMYTCEKSPPPHELFYLEIFKISYLSLFHVNIICKK